MDRFPAVYMLASKYRGVLYVGVTSNLPFRIWQHKQRISNGFCKRYHVERLVWFELHGQMYQAITREKQIKKWNRAWKIELVETANPHWCDLYDDIL